MVLLKQVSFHVLEIYREVCKGERICYLCFVLKYFRGKKSEEEIK